MINRELIRLKVVQLVYMHYQNSGQSLQKSLKELDNSLMDAYRLYCYLLLLVPEVTDFARDVYDKSCEQARALGMREMPSSKFVDNSLAALLEGNQQLRDFAESPKVHKWSEAADEIRSLYKLITASEEYQAYMAQPESTPEADRALWSTLYRKYIAPNEELDEFLEQWSIYWNDDKPIVDTFVQKTIKKLGLTENSGLMAPYDTEEDHEYARRLFEKALLNRDEYEKWIASYTRNWDFSRLPLMDIVIMVVALSEIMNIPSIDIKVSINEYLNLVRLYSDPKSVHYVNGILDSIINQMRQEGRLSK